MTLSNAALEKLAWILVYSGLLLGGLGLFVRQGDAIFGWALIAAGAVDAALGVLLIWVRSRRHS